MTKQETINEAYEKTLELYRAFSEYRFDENSKISEYDIHKRIFELMKLIGSISK